MQKFAISLQVLLSAWQRIREHSSGEPGYALASIVCRARKGVHLGLVIRGDIGQPCLPEDFQERSAWRAPA